MSQGDAPDLLWTTSSRSTHLGSCTLQATLPKRTDRSDPPVLRAGFDVPAGVTRIEVHLRASAGHVVDLGLADPSFGPYPSRRGFRGWSGGARDSVFIATNDATPGYLPGPIPSGRWWVLLGRAAVGEEGCQLEIDIHMDDSPRDVVGPTPALEPDIGGPGWYVGDLQTHTHHSDARGTLDDLLAAARQRGLDFVAVTDHNTVSHHREIAEAVERDGLAARPLMLPGIEITSYFGHANVWYPSPRDARSEPAAGWIDFRVSDDDDVCAAFDEAHRLGGLASVNHPKEQPGCIGCDWTYGIPHQADAIEAWQGPWPAGNHESLRRYDDALRAGRWPSLVGGSDRHQPAPPDEDPPWLRVGSPATRVYAEAGTGAGLLAAIAAGRVSVSEGPDGPSIEIAGTGERSGVRMGDRTRAGGPLPLCARVDGADGDVLRWVGPAGVLRTVRIRGAQFQDDWTWSDASGFVRAEVIAADPKQHAAHAEEWAARHPTSGRYLSAEPGAAWIRAVSNPIHLRPLPNGRGRAQP